MSTKHYTGYLRLGNTKLFLDSAVPGTAHVIAMV